MQEIFFSTKEQPNFTSNEVQRLLARPGALAEIPTDCPPKEMLTEHEWQAAMGVLDKVAALIGQSEAKAKEGGDGRYNFDMEIYYTHIAAYRSGQDSRLSCTVRVQPIPDSLNDFAAKTKDKKLAPEQVRERDIALTLRYQVTDTT